jgi:hypothetical protein
MHLSDAGADMVARWIAPSIHALGPRTDVPDLRLDSALATAAVSRAG